MRENERIWENLGEFGRLGEMECGGDMMGDLGKWGRYDGEFGGIWRNLGECARGFVGIWGDRWGN